MILRFGGRCKFVGIICCYILKLVNDRYYQGIGSVKVRTPDLSFTNCTTVDICIGRFLLLPIDLDVPTIA